MRNEELDTIPMPNRSVKIGICDEHWQDMVASLLQRSVHVSLDRDEVDERMRNGQLDPLVHLSTLLSTSAIHAFGIDNVFIYDGCPVCTYHNIVDMTAAHIAKDYVSVQ